MKELTKKPITKQSTLKEILNYLNPGSNGLIITGKQFKEFFNSLPNSESEVLTA